VTAVVAGHEPSLVIGDRVHIGRFCTIACVGSIEIGSDVLTADRIFVGDSHHAYEDPDRPISEQGMSVPAPVVIGPGSFIGIGAAVLEGVTVGEHAYVGAGAVVTADVAPFTLVVGNPARAVRAYDADAGAWLPV
jgi:acetyltransferase-like isoleucine patch superfamily enzyme